MLPARSQLTTAEQKPRRTAWHCRRRVSAVTEASASAAGRTTSSFRISLRLLPWRSAAGGLNCTRISTLRSLSALPAFMTNGTPAHLARGSAQSRPTARPARTARHPRRPAHLSL